MNSTFRAIRAAGFNNESFAKLQDTIMVTEPEAAAIYSARYLKDKHGGRMLKVNPRSKICLETLTNLGGRVLHSV